MTKMVQLSDEAYGVLRHAKRRDESFSQVVLRTVGHKDKGRPLEGLIGLLTAKQADEARRWITETDALDLEDARRGPWR